MKKFKKWFCKRKPSHACEELTYRVEERMHADGTVYYLAAVRKGGYDQWASYYDGGSKWRYKKTLYWLVDPVISSFGVRGLMSCKVEFPDKDLAKEMCIERCREIRNLKHKEVVEEGKCQS